MSLEVACVKNARQLIHLSLLLSILARPDRFERPTPWFEAKCSIQMSYGRFCLLGDLFTHQTRPLRQDFLLAEWTGLEPATPGVTGRYSNQLNYHSSTSKNEELQFAQFALFATPINSWRPHGDSNPGTYRERVVS